MRASGGGETDAIYNNYMTIRTSKQKHSRSKTKSGEINTGKDSMKRCDHDDVFHKYTIVDRCGTGAMGVIYKVKIKPGYRSTVVKEHHHCCATKTPIQEHHGDNEGGKHKRGFFSSLKKTLGAPLMCYAQHHHGEEEHPHEPQQAPVVTPSVSSLTTTIQTKVDDNNNIETAKGYGSDNLYALKSIHLDRDDVSVLVQELKNEIAVIQHLDHPNILKAYEVYTSIPQQVISIVMECCPGGDLYTRQTPSYTERDAASIIAQVLSAVRYMHDHGIVHRDLKYGNILFESTDLSNFTVKVIDFGSSKRFKKLGRTSIDHQYMKERVGTVYTMAPEVIQGKYTSQADLWAIGVICYTLLSNTRPFFHETSPQVVMALILKGDVSFTNTDLWDEISDDAKDFVSKLLVMDPDQRLNAENALQHPWIKQRELLPYELPAKDAFDGIHINVENYIRRTNPLKKMALAVIAHRSTPKEILELRKIFDTIDTEKDGIISLKEFTDSVLSFNFTIEDVPSAFAVMDLNHDGEINYTEFLAATIETYGTIEEYRILEAFDRIDTDGNGYISRKNLHDALGKDFTKDNVDDIMREFDLDHDGSISYEEFLSAFHL